MDAQLIRRALHEGWNIPKGALEKIAKGVAEFAQRACLEQDYKYLGIFTNLLVAMDKQQLKRVELLVREELTRQGQDLTGEAMQRVLNAMHGLTYPGAPEAPGKTKRKQ